MRTAVPLAERLERLSDRSGDCWIWTLVLDHKGYGRIKIANRYYRAHRVAYETLVGPIPDGLVIDHLCRNRACINPAHLEPVPLAENIRRGLAGYHANHPRGPRRPRGPLKTHCVHGHEYTPENTYWFPGRPGARSCLTCQRERDGRRSYRKQQPT